MPPPSAEIISRMAQVLGVREYELLARAGQLTTETWRWFWSQPAALELLACASGMNESLAQVYIMASLTQLAGSPGAE
jgi:hypothetical protein